MKWKAKVSLLIAIAFMLSVVLAACGGGSSNSSSSSNSGSTNTTESSSSDDSGSSKMADKQVLNLDIKTEPPSLDPRQATDTTSFTVLNQVFEGLTRIGKDGKPHLATAKSIKRSDDGLTYTITIRDDAKWSNGDPVVSKDFTEAWKWVQNPENAAKYASIMYIIKNAKAINSGKMSPDKLGVEIINKKKFKVHLEHPASYFKQLLAHQTFFPVNHTIAKKHPKWYTDAGKYYVGNGPFKLKKWEHKDIIVLVPNEYYWDKESVHLDKVKMVMVKEPTTALQMYKNGKLDWIGTPTVSIPLSAIPSMKKKGKLNIQPQSAIYYYAFNVKKKPFNNAKIRKAFSLAIDRKAIVNQITKGGQIPATALVPPSIWPENKKNGYFPGYDVEKAKKLLKQGMKELGIDKLPPITISYNTSKSHKAIAVAIQQMWKQAFGIKVQLDNAEWKVYLQNLSQGNFQVGRMGWVADFDDPINFLNLFKYLGGNNKTNWHSDKYAQLLTKSDNTTSAKKRKELLKKAEKLFMQARPIAPIYFYSSVWSKKPYVKNVVMHGTGLIELKSAYIAKH